MDSQLPVRMMLDAWNGQLKHTTDLLDKISDEQLMKEIAPGKNRGIYLLGHLAAVHDRMLPLLGLGPEVNPAMFPIFVSAPDKTIPDLPSIPELRSYWSTVNNRLSEAFAALTADEWFERHTSISEEDFKSAPHRNRLNVLLSRTTHLAGHHGQLVYLK
jgi:hypothetical protein